MVLPGSTIACLALLTTVRALPSSFFRRVANTTAPGADGLTALKPIDWHQLQGSNDTYIKTLFDSLGSNYTHKAVSLASSPSITNISCGSDSTVAITFADQTALDYVKTAWKIGDATQGFIIITPTFECKPSTDKRSYWLVTNSTFPSNSALTAVLQVEDLTAPAWAIDCDAANENTTYLGLPTGSCGDEFDPTLDEQIGFYDFNKNFSSSLKRFAPGLQSYNESEYQSVGTQRREHNWRKRALIPRVIGRAIANITIVNALENIANLTLFARMIQEEAIYVPTFLDPVDILSVVPFAPARTAAPIPIAPGPAPVRPSPIPDVSSISVLPPAASPVGPVPISSETQPPSQAIPAPPTTASQEAESIVRPPAPAESLPPSAPQSPEPLPRSSDTPVPSQAETVPPLPSSFPESIAPPSSTSVSVPGISSSATNPSSSEQVASTSLASEPGSSLAPPLSAEIPPSSLPIVSPLPVSEPSEVASVVQSSISSILASASASVQPSPSPSSIIPPTSSPTLTSSTTTTISDSATTSTTTTSTTITSSTITSPASSNSTTSISTCSITFTDTLGTIRPCDAPQCYLNCSAGECDTICTTITSSSDSGREGCRYFYSDAISQYRQCPDGCATYCLSGECVTVCPSTSPSTGPSIFNTTEQRFTLTSGPSISVVPSPVSEAPVSSVPSTTVPVSQDAPISSSQDSISSSSVIVPSPVSSTPVSSVPSITVPVSQDAPIPSSQDSISPSSVDVPSPVSSTPVSSVPSVTVPVSQDGPILSSQDSSIPSSIAFSVSLDPESSSISPESSSIDPGPSSVAPVISIFVPEPSSIDSGPSSIISEPSSIYSEASSSFEPGLSSASPTSSSFDPESSPSAPEPSYSYTPDPISSSTSPSSPVYTGLRKRQGVADTIGQLGRSIGFKQTPIRESSQAYGAVGDEQGNIRMASQQVSDQVPWNTWGDSAVTDSLDRFLHYFPDILEKFGVSRLRVADSEQLPQGSSAIAFTPIDVSTTRGSQSKRQSNKAKSVYVPLNTRAQPLVPIMCKFQDSIRSKLYLANSAQGVQTLQNPRLRKVLTGGKVGKCGVISLESRTVPGLSQAQARGSQ